MTEFLVKWSNCECSIAILCCFFIFKKTNFIIIIIIIINNILLSINNWPQINSYTITIKQAPHYHYYCQCSYASYMSQWTEQAINVYTSPTLHRYSSLIIPKESITQTALKRCRAMERRWNRWAVSFASDVAMLRRRRPRSARRAVTVALYEPWDSTAIGTNS